MPPPSILHSPLFSNTEILRRLPGDDLQWVWDRIHRVRLHQIQFPSPDLSLRRDIHSHRLKYIVRVSDLHNVRPRRDALHFKVPILSAKSV